MDCPQRQLLSAYHDGELDPAAQGELEGHVSVCPACAADLRELAAMSGLFAAEHRPGLSQMARYRLHDRTESVMRSDILRLARAMQAIAACVLVGASIWLMRWPNPGAGDSGGEAAMGGTASVQAAPPWLDVAVTASAETNSLDATTPAAAWYLADYTSRGDDWH